MESLLINRFEQALLALDRLAIKSLLKQLRKKWEAIQCIEKVVVPALERISEGWKKGEIASESFTRRLEPVVLNCRIMVGRQLTSWLIGLIKRAFGFF